MPSRSWSFEKASSGNARMAASSVWSIAGLGIREAIAWLFGDLRVALGSVPPRPLATAKMPRSGLALMERSGDWGDAQLEPRAPPSG
jgi:hypothetical protein